MKKPILIALAVLLALASGYYIYSKRSQPLEVETYTIKKGNLRKIISGSGEVQSEKQIELTFPTAGKVATTSAKVNGHVKKGEIVAKLDKNDLYYNLQQAEANRDSALAAYESAKSALTITYDDWKEDLDSPSEYVKSQLDRAQKSVDQAKAQLEAAETQVQLAKNALQNANLTSPISGTVVEINADEGEQVSPTVPFAIIADLDQLIFKLEIDEEELGLITVGDSADIYLEAWRKEALQSQVLKISPKGTKTTSGATVFLVDLAVPTQQKAKIGMTGRAEVVVNEKNNIVKVPFEALLTANGDNYVYLLKNEKAAKQVIETGLKTDSYHEVINGLQKGDKVIVSELTKLENGKGVKEVENQ